MFYVVIDLVIDWVTGTVARLVGRFRPSNDR